MKKIIALILAALMLVFCVACGNTNNTNDTNDTNDTTDTTSAPVAEPAKPADEVLNEALNKYYELLAVAFGASAQDVSGSFSGGYFGEDPSAFVQEAAGRTPVDVEEAVASLQANGYVTEDVLAKIDDAALFGHAMNAASLTMTVLHVANSSDVDAVASAMRDSIGGNEVWMCGFPEKYIVIKIGDYVVSGYGKVDFVDPLKTAITETYADAVVSCDEVIE